jgi:hypothetical protein
MWLERQSVLACRYGLLDDRCLAKPDLADSTLEKQAHHLRRSPTVRAAQIILSYTKAFCFIDLMKPALALLAIIGTSKPS